jgi:hypothetical protein
MILSATHLKHTLWKIALQTNSIQESSASGEYASAYFLFQPGNSIPSYLFQPGNSIPSFLFQPGDSIPSYLF